MIDCFMFFNEFDLLEIRLNSLAPYIDKFVLCESTVTHSGKPKPLYFENNKERFSKFNITHLVADDRMIPNADLPDSWRRENYQREYIINALDDVDPETTVLISDLDEIPDLESYCVEGMEGSFRQRLYYYYLNVYAGMCWWRGTIAIRRKNIVTISQLRDGRWKHPALASSRSQTDTGTGKGQGWHFSTLGTLDDIVLKFRSGAHTEMDVPDLSERIDNCRAALLDPYRRFWKRRPRKCIIEMPSGPTWLLENKEKYKQLFYED